MADTNEIAGETVIIREPGGTEIRWRTQRMTSLGADATLAAEVANSRADVHDIERLLDAGCSLELAWAITRPVGDPTTAVMTTQESASNEDSS
jgi:hypothetical protein